MTGSTMFWYVSRATGVVALLLFTAVLTLGLMVTRKARLAGLPGFAVTSLHRNLSLLGLGFVVVHVLTAVLDGYVRIPLVSAVIPFASGYERFWLGLGAVALDLIVAMILTSLVRGRLPRRWWRPVHLLAYLSWPVSLAHCLGAGEDLRHGWLFDLAAGCALLVLAATAWRLAAAARQLPRAARVAAVFTRHAEHSRGPGHTVRDPASR
jgi:methionine sulfoxide reductase heme-binding subunit